jgi:probable rRNA maturation factor
VRGAPADPDPGPRGRSIYLRPWRVDALVRPGVRSPRPVAGLARDLVAALEAGGAPRPASIGLVLSDDTELADLNAAHMGVAGPTDVLSFPLLPRTAFPRQPGSAPGPVPATAPAPAAAAFDLPPGRRPHLGDVVVSVERAIAQAGTGRGGQTGDVRWSAADELRLLVIHGGLHVCGWDHAAPAEEASMRDLERRLLAVGDGVPDSGSTMPPGTGR